MRNSKLTHLFLLAAATLALCLSLNSPVGVSAQSPTPLPPLGPIKVTDDQVNAVAKTLYCPVCENIPLDVCPTQACAQWRDLIRLKLSEGWQKEQIRQYFAQVYGDRVLSEPPKEGLNLLVYILPPVIFLVGLFLVYRVLRSNRKPALAAEKPALDPAQDPYLKRLEDELKKKK